MTKTTQWTQITAHMWIGEYKVDDQTYYQVHDRSDMAPLNAGYTSWDEAAADAQRYEAEKTLRDARNSVEH